MAETIAAGGRGTPCTMRLFDATSMAPIWIGLLISASFMAGLGLLALAFGWTWVAVMLPVDVLVSLVVGFLPVVTAYGLRGAVRDLHDLRPALDLRDADFAQWVDGIGRFPGVGLPIVSLGALVVGALLPVSEGFWHTPPPLDHPLRWWVTFRIMAVAWLLARTIFIEIVVALRFMRLGRDHAKVDLLDLAPLRPFALHGLRSVLFLMSFLALFSVNFLIGASGQETYGLTGIAVVVFALASLALPTLGVQQRIHARKREEVQRVDGAIRRESEARLEPAGEWQDAHARLSDLVVYRGMLQSLHTWPIDVSTLLRFGLYLVVGLGSWLGAAFVERLVGLVFD